MKKKADIKLPRILAQRQARADRLLKALQSSYPNPHCELDFSSPHELLVATILSAQATDVSVNKATPALFRKFPTPAAFAASTPESIEPFIRTIGLYRSKAKSVHSAMTTLVTDFGGQVPRTMDELLLLRGVARKTANVVLGNAFQINVGFVVDTHIQRLSQRLNLVPRHSNVATIERWMMAQFPQKLWCDVSHMIIFHGRRVCKARGNGGCCVMENSICREFGTACDLPRSAKQDARG